MAERDSMKTPVAAEALIAADPLALHSIPCGRTPPLLPAAPVPRNRIFSATGQRAPRVVTVPAAAHRAGPPCRLGWRPRRSPA